MQTRRNNETQNRREFFKEAAKKALPILGVFFMSKPLIAHAEEILETGCKTGCSGGCRTLCEEGCSHSCNGGCKDTCEGRCKDTCKGSATNYWK